ncbi:MAG: O-antigen ligase family protein [Pyrinomonadaceae bacterium]|nr:O-antigen ligase family protein [Pyrinomonadaceae bacterium]
MFSINPKQSFIKLAGEFYILSLSVLTFNLVNSETRFRKLIKIWLYGTTVTIFIGLLTIFLFYFDRDNFLLQYTNSIFGAVPVGNYPRLTSTFGSASMFCNYLNVSLCFLFIAEKLKILRPFVFRVLLILSTICAIFTISSGIGGIILAFAIWFWLLLKENRKLLARSALVGGIVAAAVLFFINFIALQPHPTAPFTFNFLGFELYPSGRLMIWTETLQTISANFFNGTGLGQEVCRVNFQNTDGSSAYLTDAHNIFLSVAGQNGIFGLISFTILVFYILKQVFSKRFIGNYRSSFIFYLLAAAFVCAFLYQGLTGSFEDARHLWVLVGLIFSAKTFLPTS